MFSLDIFAIVGIAAVLVFLGVLFLLPGDRRPQAMHRQQRAREEKENKDWQAACLKLEKHIHALHGVIEQGKSQARKLEKDLLIQREKNKKLQEKISQERGWQEKEAAEKERRGQEIARLKEALLKTEQEAQKEHGELLRLEREIKEAKGHAAAAAETKRQLEAQIAKLTVQLDNAKTELDSLREQNARLSKAHDETTWIAKFEYVKLEQQLRSTEEEFRRFKSQIRKESL